MEIEGIDVFDWGEVKSDAFYLYKWEGNKKLFIQKTEIVPELDEISNKFGGGKYSIYFKQDGKSTTRTFFIAEKEKKEVTSNNFEAGFRFATEQINATINNILSQVLPVVGQGERKLDRVYQDILESKDKQIRALTTKANFVHEYEDEESDDEEEETESDFDPIEFIKPYIDDVETILGNGIIAKTAIAYIKNSREFQKIISNSKEVMRVLKYIQSVKGNEIANQLKTKLEL